jgi:protease secretion system outer membrane protein
MRAVPARGRLRALLAAALLAAWASTAAAQTLDLAQAHAAALVHDASLRASRAAADAGREAVPQARARLLPEISAGYNRSRNQLISTGPGFAGTSTTTRDSYVAGSAALTLRQGLYRPFHAAGLRQARARVEESEASLGRDLQNLAVRVSEAYFELLLADQQIALVAAQRTALRTQLDAATQGFAAGSGTRTDIDEVRARLDMSTAEELQADQHRLLARRDLEAMVGAPFDAVAALDVAALQRDAGAPAGIEAWIALAERNSPEIRALQAQRDTARFEIEKARAGHLPTLDAVAEWSRNDSDNINRIGSRYTSKMVGLQLTIPIFAGGAIESGVRQAVATEVRAGELLQALRQDLGTRLHREHAALGTGVLRMRALEQAVRSAEQVVQSNRRSFAAGSRTTVDILDAEQRRVAALRDLAQARYAYLMSRVRLDVIAGVFDDAKLRQLNAFFIVLPPTASPPPALPKNTP